ncbi:hypothetical protein GTQ99_09245 [Kineococcus sp. T13]|uniref:hypothetical protein n=1 Tax=Kineococcus vitellinus TaxID=2696565 RepID=UPI001413789C|nr:hypothetical protein [Kineococcus vitellinus]NAZ75603.1 hypothetical protein [Kineococcus vitellinus]
MNAHPGDPDGLDGNPKDGIACEGLPHRPQTPAPTPQCLWGAVAQRYDSTGGANGSLGEVTQCQQPTPLRAGEYAHFRGGSIYYSTSTGAQFTRGAIRDKWAATGWENGRLGFPTTSDAPTPNGRGWYTHFQGASVYWSPQTGAHFTAGAIKDQWALHGWENGGLGFPATDDTSTPNGRGYYTHFQGGSIYWSPATGAHDVRGAIRDKWASTGWENGHLGFSRTGDTRTPNGSGYYNHFQGGSIYWSPATGANIVLGAIGQAWASQGWESGALGYPVEDEHGWDEDYIVQQFQGGFIGYTPGVGAQIYYGERLPEECC